LIAKHFTVGLQLNLRSVLKFTESGREFDKLATRSQKKLDRARP